MLYFFYISTCLCFVFYVESCSAICMKKHICFFVCFSICELHIFNMIFLDKIMIFFSTFTRGFRFIFTEQNKKPKYVAFYVKTSLLIMTLMFIAQLFYFVNIFHLYLNISIEKTWISLIFRKKKCIYKSKTSFNKYISSSSLFYFEAL